MKKILVFQHIKREHPSLIAEYAAERGMVLDIVPLFETNIIPQVSAYDALIVLGGPMGAYEEYQGKTEELTAIKSHIGSVPMLGICLGAQLLAYALGASVYPWQKDGKRCKEIGYYDISLTPDGEAGGLFAGFPSKFSALQWHGDTFDLPQGAILLATDSECPHQAFSYGNAYGVQFHVEATPEIVSDWIHEDRAWISQGFALDEKKIANDAERLKSVMRTQCFRMLDNFMTV